jgi:hypothetical protein
MGDNLCLLGGQSSGCLNRSLLCSNGLILEPLVSICLALSGELVIGVSPNHAASHASKNESDKLWDADPYGLQHDVADGIHYLFVVLIAAVIGFMVARMTPNEKS